MKDNKKEQDIKTLQSIAVEVLTSGWLDKQLSTLSQDKMLMDDLAQEILISIMEYPNDKLIECYLKGEHLYFIKKMITNQYCSKNSSFYYTYRKDVCSDIEDVINKENNNNSNEEIY